MNDFPALHPHHVLNHPAFKRATAAKLVFPLSVLPGRNRHEKRMYRTIADRIARGTARKSEAAKLRALMAQLHFAAAQARGELNP